MTDQRIESELEIKTYDIDVAGHVNNIVYVRWLEDLRSKLLSTRRPVSEMLERDFYPVVVSTQIRYRTQLTLTNKLKGVIWIESVKHGLMHLRAVFQKGESSVASAEQDCVMMNLRTGKMDKKAMEYFSGSEK